MSPKRNPHHRKISQPIRIVNHLTGFQVIWPTTEGIYVAIKLISEWNSSNILVMVMIIYDFKEIARHSISIIILSTALTDL